MPRPLFQAGTCIPRTVGYFSFKNVIKRSCQQVAYARRALDKTSTEVQPAVPAEAQIPLLCSRLAHNGRGICFLSENSRRIVVFCTGALPGETVLAEINKVGSLPSSQLAMHTLIIVPSCHWYIFVFLWIFGDCFLRWTASVNRHSRLAQDECTVAQRSKQWSPPAETKDLLGSL